MEHLRIELTEQQLTELEAIENTRRERSKQGEVCTILAQVIVNDGFMSVRLFGEDATMEIASALLKHDPDAVLDKERWESDVQRIHLNVAEVAA